jgi:cobaltochelatase CobN
MLRRLSLLVVLALIVASGFSRKMDAQGPGPIRIAFLYSDGNLPSTLKAWKAVLAERPQLKSRVTFTFLTESVFEDVKPADMTAADVLVLDIMNQQMLDRFNAKHKIDLLGEVRRRGRIFAVGEGLLPKDTYTRQGARWDDRARAFWQHSGFNNQVGLLKYALSQGGVTGLTIPAPQPSLDFGYYYPDGGNGQVFRTWGELVAWKQAHGKLRPGAPRVALGFYKSAYYSGETELLDAVIAEIERRGAEAIPLFGYPGEVASERLLIDEAGGARADAQLGFYFNFSGPDAAKSLSKLDIPNINLISLYGRSEQEWRASAQGLSMFEGTFQIAVPELAGTVAPTVVGSQEKVKDPDTGLTIVVRRPIASRISTAVSRALKYGALR